MNAADVAVVYFNPLTIAHKRLEPITEEDIKEAFKREDLNVFTDSQALAHFLEQQDWKDTNLLLMSSGTFGNLDTTSLVKYIIQ